MVTKKPAWKNFHKPGSHVSPACLATYFTWLQAGRLKSPRDKSCSYSVEPFPSRRPSDSGKRLVFPLFGCVLTRPEDQRLTFTVAADANGILPDRMIAAMADDGLILPA